MVHQTSNANIKVYLQYMVFTCVGHIIQGFTMACVQKRHVNHSKCLCVLAGGTANVKNMIHFMFL